MKKIIFGIILFALFIPMIQYTLNIFKLRPLAGVTISEVKPELNPGNWWNDAYQIDYDEYFSQNFGLRNSFIRLSNQVDFTVFKKSHANVIIGKQNYLFQSEYINEITGRNFIGDEEMKLKIENIRKTQNYLDNKNIFLFTVLAPGKSDYYKEYLPSYCSDKFTDKRNYTAILNYSKQENIRLLDLNKIFLQIKDTSTNPLFPIHGIHWNTYGVAIALDTIIKYINSEKGIKLPGISWTMEPSPTLQGTDYDLGDLLNIYQKLHYDKVAYPKFNITSDSLSPKLRLLVVGDSFYWNIFFTDVFKKVFKKETFFYYCSAIHPKDSMVSNFVSDLNFAKEIENYDIILLLQSSGNYHNPGVGFIQYLSNDLNRRKEFKNKALTLVEENKLLIDRSVEIANKLNIPLDSAKSFLTDSLVNARFDQISKIKIQMRNNSDWMSQIDEKSALMDKGQDIIMQEDAEWMIDQQNK